MRDIIKCFNIIIAFKDKVQVCDLLYKKWHIVKETQRTLKPLYQATIVMQKSDFTMSDFYASWEQVEEKLNKYVRKDQGAQFALLLLQSMAKRKHSLLDNPAMLCALALDPRFCSELDDEQKKISKNALLNLWKKMKSFENKKALSHLNPIALDDSGSSTDEDISIASTTVLKDYMNKKKIAKKFDSNVNQIGEKIDSFISQNHEIPDGTIYDFWIKVQNDFPELFEMAQIIFAISPTQAIVEQSFSILSHTFPPNRNQLNEKNLDDILVICLNEDLFSIVNDEDVDNIMNNREQQNP